MRERSILIEGTKPIERTMKRHLDLFSGIGGFSLGLERTGGFETVAFCEIDGWCRQQLARNWPGVPIHKDIEEFDGGTIGDVDIVTGGFPCQDISHANTSAKGIDGARSGLVFEMLRVIREVRPTWVVIENSPALRVRGADRVLDELEGQGYVCWPLVVGARHVLAPHRRDRVWIVAHTSQPVSERRREVGRWGRSEADVEGSGATPAAHPCNSGLQGLWGAGGDAAEVSTDESTLAGREASDTYGFGVRQQSGGGGRESGREAPQSSADAHSHLDSQPQQSVHGQMGGGESVEGNDGEPWGWWHGGPSAHLRVDDGLSTRVARQWLKAYGNSVVPPIVEAIGYAILKETVCSVVNAAALCSGGGGRLSGGDK